MLALERRDDTTYADLDRFAILRHGTGLKIVEVAPAAVAAEPTVAGRAPRRLPRREEHENPLTPFDHAQLRALGLDGDTIEAVRAMRPSVELAEALAERGLPAEVVELVGDAWSDRDRYLAIFADGRTPTIDDARIEEAELAERVASSGQSDAIAALDERDFEAVLAGSIEEWMFYLHPTQARVARHPATGPSRVRGGPGTGKTVAALHRARHLVREGIAERVLLTTFVERPAADVERAARALRGGRGAVDRDAHGRQPRDADRQRERRRRSGSSPTTSAAGTSSAVIDTRRACTTRSAARRSSAWSSTPCSPAAGSSRSRTTGA